MDKKDTRSEQKGNDEPIRIIKLIVQESLEELEKVEEHINDLQRKKASLKRDIMDLKEGRLDRIEERHSIDVESKLHSVFTVTKKIEIGAKDNSPWYIPYVVQVLDHCGDSPSKYPEKFTINNSLTKINSSGVYKLENGKIRNL